ncbi:MAG: MFS transporter [Acidobacteriota bacterium]|nr:MFS transporter [Acidobacteriota bacterium]
MLFNSCQALVQIQTPENMRGRILSIYNFVFFGLMPFCALWVGRLAHLTGVKIPAPAVAPGLLLYGILLSFFDRHLIKLL